MANVSTYIIQKLDKTILATVKANNINQAIELYCQQQEEGRKPENTYVLSENKVEFLICCVSYTAELFKGAELRAIKNDLNDFSKRTSSQVSVILKANGIQAKVENLGDSRTFEIALESSLKNRAKLKSLGFILLSSGLGDKSIVIKVF